MPHIVFPDSWKPLLELLLRWVHYSAGITWVGLLYFFVLVNTPFLKETDASIRAKIVPPLMLRALWWFRWTAVVTVLAGITYWMMIISTDTQNARAMYNVETHGGMAIGTFFVIWTLVFALEMGMLMSPAEFLKRGPVFTVIMAIAVIAGAWLYLAFNSHRWESNRLLAIGIGGGLGWFMLLNVWGIIWRIQKKLIRWTREGAAKGTPMPPEAAQLSRVALLTARTNFVLSFPMLLMMAVASHYSIFGR